MGVLSSRWWIVAACACGLLVGSGAILIFTFGVFLKPVTEDLGISRGTLSGGLGVSAWSVALSCPIVGWLIDRFGTRRVMIPGILVFALAVAGFGLMQPQPLLIYAIFCIAGFISAVQSPIPYATVITHWFDRNRGMALGVATAGVGLGVALMPQLAAFLIRHFGWRYAYFGLGIAVVVLAWIPVVIFVRDPPRTSRAGRAGATSELPGVSVATALKSRDFWLLSIAFFLGVLAINGTIVHIVPLLTDRGIALQLATTALSVAGIAIIVGRIVCGWCLDRFWGPYVAICFFVLPMAGIALLISGLPYPVLLIGAALCGAGIGAEIDQMAFFIGRYFGLKAYGKIYGFMFMLFNIGTGIGPALSGLAFDRFHSYSQILVGYEIVLGVTCLLLLGLGEYTFHPAQHVPEPIAN